MAGVTEPSSCCRARRAEFWRRFSSTASFFSPRLLLTCIKQQRISDKNAIDETIHSSNYWKMAMLNNDDTYDKHIWSHFTENKIMMAIDKCQLTWQVAIGLLLSSLVSSSPYPTLTHD